MSNAKIKIPKGVRSSKLRSILFSWLKFSQPETAWEDTKEEVAKDIYLSDLLFIT